MKSAVCERKQASSSFGAIERIARQRHRLEIADGVVYGLRSSLGFIYDCRYGARNVLECYFRCYIRKRCIAALHPLRLLVPALNLCSLIIHDFCREQFSVCALLRGMSSWARLSDSVCLCRSAVECQNGFCEIKLSTKSEREKREGKRGKDVGGNGRCL